MTSEQLATTLLSFNKGKDALSALNQLTPELVRFNNVLVSCTGLPLPADEPLTSEVLAIAALTADLYLIKNILKDIYAD